MFNWVRDSAIHTIDGGVDEAPATAEEILEMETLYTQILEDIEKSDKTFSHIKGACSLVSGFTGWLAIAVPKDVPCPSYAISIYLSAALSLCMLIVFTVLDFLTSRLKGMAKADFVYDTRGYRAFGFVSLFYSLPLFMLSFALFCRCEYDEPWDSILFYIFLICTIGTVCVIYRLVYLYNPQMMYFLLLVPIGIGPLIYPNGFEQFGDLTSKRSWVSYHGKHVHMEIKNGKAKLQPQKEV